MVTTVTPSGQPFVVQARLTQIAMAVKNEMFIADDVCPRIPVEAEKFQYTKVNTAERFRIPDTKIGRTSKAHEVEFSSYDETDRTVDVGLEDPVPLKDVKNANAANNYDPLAMATEGTTALIELARESRVATLYFTAANYKTGLKSTLSGNDQWNSGHADSTPLDDINGALDSMLIRANTMILGQSAWTGLRTNPQIVEAVLGTGADRGQVSREAVAELLELDEIQIGKGWYDSAKKGQTASNARLWGKKCALLHINRAVRSTRTTMPTFAFTAEFGRRMAGTYMDPGRGVLGCEVVKVVEMIKELISWQEAGYLFSDVVS